jgi:hypothetical protein
MCSQFVKHLFQSTIAHLQNSMEHLAAMQSVLEEAIQADLDLDLLEAIGDDRVVMYMHPSLPTYLAARCSQHKHIPLLKPHITSSHWWSITTFISNPTQTASFHAAEPHRTNTSVS